MARNLGSRPSLHPCEFMNWDKTRYVITVAIIPALALVFLWMLFSYRADAAALAGAVIAAWLKREKSRQRATARAHQEQRELSEELSKRTEAESTEAHRDGAEEARKWLDRPF